MYMIYVRTNNHLEGSHSRYSKSLGSATPTFANLVDLLKDESQSVLVAINEVYAGTSRDNPSKDAAARNDELDNIWSLWELGRIRDVTELLDELTKRLQGPNPNIVALYAEPDDADSDDVDEPQEQTS